MDGDTAFAVVERLDAVAGAGGDVGVIVNDDVAERTLEFACSGVVLAIVGDVGPAPKKPARIPAGDTVVLVVSAVPSELIAPFAVTWIVLAALVVAKVLVATLTARMPLPPELIWSKDDVVTVMLPDSELLASMPYWPCTPCDPCAVIVVEASSVMTMSPTP